MKKEFMDNMIKAKRYEMKALYSLLPDSVRDGLEAGGKELLKMVVEYGMEILQEESGVRGEQEKTVRKVSID